MIFSAIKTGLKKSWQIRKILLLFWLFNLFVALFFIHPFYSSFHSFFAQREAAEVLSRQNVYTYLSEFFFFKEQAIQMAGKTTLLGGLVLTVFNLLMSGGLVSAILNEKPVTLRKFWSECGYYFGRMVRLLILTAIVFLVLIFLIFWLWSVLKGLLPRYASEYVPLSVFCLWILISAGVGLIGFLFIDIIRIRIVQLDAQSIFRNSLWALNLLLKNPVRLLSMYLMIHILWVSLLVLYGWFQSFVSDGTYSGLLVNFLGLQLGVILQYGVRFSKFGALQQILLSVDTMQEQERKILGE